MPKTLADIKEVTKEFGEAHAEEARWKSTKERLRKQFFDLLRLNIPTTQLAQTTIYYDGTDPEQHVATLYPKYMIVDKRFDLATKEWRILLREDIDRKSWSYVNPVDGNVYSRTVAESAPEVDLERLKADHPSIYKSVTFQPKPARQLKPLDKLTERQKATIMRYLKPPKLQDRMEKPRKAKAEELEEIS
jgi:hypothetical protein